MYVGKNDHQPPTLCIILCMRVFITLNADQALERWKWPLKIELIGLFELDMIALNGDMVVQLNWLKIKHMNEKICYDSAMVSMEDISR